MLNINIYYSNNNLYYNYFLPKKKFLLNLIKKFLLNLIDINLCFVSLLDIYILNKNYKYINNPTNILVFKNFDGKRIFNSDIILCPLILEKESINRNLKLLIYYFFILIHGLFHIQNIHHYTNFEKVLINFIANNNLFKLKAYFNNIKKFNE